MQVEIILTTVLKSRGMKRIVVTIAFVGPATLLLTLVLTVARKPPT